VNVHGKENAKARRPLPRSLPNLLSPFVLFTSILRGPRFDQTCHVAVSSNAAARRYARLSRVFLTLSSCRKRVVHLRSTYHAKSPQGMESTDTSGTPNNVFAARKDAEAWLRDRDESAALIQPPVSLARAVQSELIFRTTVIPGSFDHPWSFDHFAFLLSFHHRSS
jgi:hypothetical protein